LEFFFGKKQKKFCLVFCSYFWKELKFLCPTIVTTAHQKASGMDLKNDISVPASAK
jgi:hypothetical protein